MAAILIRQQRRRAERPDDTDIRIVPEDAAVVGGIVVVGALIGDVGAFAQHAEPMRETRRDIELLMRTVIKYGAGPASEPRRAAAYVHRHVEYLPATHAHQLALGLP